MSYSDYGGYAYRNGVRIESRSDCTITPEGDAYGSPGMYPGFALIAQGLDHSEVMKRQKWPSGHAVLGDGPIYVVMYKQSSLCIYRGPKKLDDLALLKDAPPDAIKTWVDAEGKEHRWLKTDYYNRSEDLCTFEVDGWKVEVYFRIEDNQYQYCKLTQPDGNVWTGFSGYGVGAGLEDAGYGYSTEDREDVLQELFPNQA